MNFWDGLFRLLWPIATAAPRQTHGFVIFVQKPIDLGGQTFCTFCHAWKPRAAGLGAKGEARSLTERACLARGHVTEISTADIKWREVYACEPSV